MQKYQDNVQNRNGDAVVGAHVQVLTYPSGAAATIYSDNGITPAANPLSTDTNGAFAFYAADGRYSLMITGNSIAPITVTDITIAEELLTPQDFGALGDGVTDDTAACAAVVARALASGRLIQWEGAFLTTANIPNFHDVRHEGSGIIKRGSDLFYVSPKDSQTNRLYLAASGGSSSNDGLSASQPFSTFQNAFDALVNHGDPVLPGRWEIVSAAGTHSITSGSHNHTTPSKNRVVIRGPVAGHPNVPTCIVDGGGNGAAYTHGINCDGIGVRVEVRDIKFQNYTEASGNTRIGLVAANGADLYTNNVHGLSCSWAAIYAKETEQARFSGGILDANNTGAYCIISDSSHSSIGYGAASTSDGPIIKKAVSAGVYFSTGSQGHTDYCTFEDNGVAFLVAENSRCDTVGNDFKRNTVAIRAITGGKFGEGGTPNNFNNGGADANTTNVEYKAYSGDIAELDDQGSGSWQRVAFDRANHALSGTTPTTLSTPYTIAANRLKGIGKACRVHALGVFTQATAGSTMTVNFGGMTFTVAVPAAATNIAFEIDVTLYEVAGGYRAIGKLGQGLNAQRFGNATAGFTNTSDQAISIAATLANAGDSMNLYRVDVYLIG
jgi:hypothetical protein